MTSIDEQIEHNEDFQKRESISSTPGDMAVFSISQPVVKNPSMKENIFNNYMVYKVTFKFNSADQEVSRRFSDFDSLRKALRLYRPFSYIYPVHRKQIIVY